ncbi:hypothetical protein P4S72_18305 [Vibrio sp. PP-XX7]
MHKLLFCPLTANGSPQHDDHFNALKRALSAPKHGQRRICSTAQALGFNEWVAQYFSAQGDPDKAAQNWMLANKPKTGGGGFLWSCLCHECGSGHQHRPQSATTPVVAVR